LDGIDEICQDLVLLHLPPPVRDDNTIIPFGSKRTAEGGHGRVRKIDGVVLPVFYQTLDMTRFP